MTYYNGMTLYEIADQSMSEHSRWDEDHRSICVDCYSDWVDFCHDQVDDARLDAMSEQ